MIQQKYKYGQEVHYSKQQKIQKIITAAARIQQEWYTRLISTIL